MKLLLVEDSDSDAYLLEENLSEDRHIQYVITRVVRVSEALTVIKQQSFDAILLDLHLPDAQALEGIVAMRRQTQLPIVVLTGHDDEALGIQAIKEGAQDYLEKNKVKAHEIAKSLNYAIERFRIQREIEYLAYTDALTAIPNRNLFMEQLAKAIELANHNKQAFALHMIDLDGFKSINDCYGHNAGDQALIKVTQRLLNLVRAKDVFARIGGDEFALLQFNIESQQCSQLLADRLVAAMHEPFEIDGQETTIGLTIGLAFFPQDGTNAKTLMRHADEALYEGKASSKNQRIVDEV